MRKFLWAVLVLGLSTNLGGCVLLAAAGGGYMIADEVSEGDGKMDPLEKVRDKENGAN